MPPDTLESRLDRLHAQPAPPPPGSLISAVAQRRRVRTLAHVAAAAGLLLLVGSITVMLRQGPAQSELGVAVVTASDQTAPTLAAINAANPDLSPETLRLPAPASGGAEEPLTIGSSRSLGG